MPTRPTHPGSLHRSAVDATGSPATFPATLARREPTLLPIRPALRPRLCSRKESDPSCLQQSGASGLLRVFRRQTRESPFFSCFDRLAAGHRNARLRFPIGSTSHLSAQAIVDPIEGSIESPAPVTGMDRRVVRKITGQVPPLASGTYQVAGLRPRPHAGRSPGAVRSALEQKAERSEPTACRSGQKDLLFS